MSSVLHYIEYQLHMYMYKWQEKLPSQKLLLTFLNTIKAKNKWKNIE